MILEILLIPLLFVSFSGWGAWVKMLLGDKNDSFSLTVILGFSFFGFLTSSLSFFIPLSLYIELVLLILSLIPFFLKKMHVYLIRFPKALLKSVWFWVFCLIIIFIGSYYPFRPDHFSYYVPSVYWLNCYGLIPGVANIDWILGQMSVFHIIQAGLDQTIDPFQRLNVFITILFLVYLFERKAYLLLVVIPIYFLFIQTSSPDVAIVFLSLVIVNELCFNYRIDKYKILLFIAVFIFIIKPIAFWLPLWVFVASIFLNKKVLKDYQVYLIPALLVIIFLIKNVIASSTLFYPVSLTKVNTYWLPDFRIIELSDQLASLYTFNKYFTENEISRMTFFHKIYSWLTISELRSILKSILVITILVFGVFSFFKKNSLYQMLWITIVIKFLVIFNFSGQYRFILDGFFPLVYILFHSIRIEKTKIYIAFLSFSFLLITLISYPQLVKQSFPNFKLANWMVGFRKKTLLTPGRYVNNLYSKENIGNLDFYISYYVLIFDTPPPAFTKKYLQLYDELGVFPQMKDPANIRKGYYMKTLEPEEKEKLRKIIEKYPPDD